jgi:hypothetical protein
MAQVAGGGRRFPFPQSQDCQAKDKRYRRADRALLAIIQQTTLQDRLSIKQSPVAGERNSYASSYIPRRKLTMIDSTTWACEPNDSIPIDSIGYGKESSTCRYESATNGERVAARQADR